MALLEGCQHELEVTVPVQEVQEETEKVVANIQQKVRLPGFRPGKAPASLVRTRFQADIRQEVLEHLLPRAFFREAQEQNLKVVGRPDVVDIHYHDGEPLRFKAKFEVAPEIQLSDYRGLEVPYADPVVADTDIDERLAQMREQKAEYVNEDPRPLQDGDYALVDIQNLTEADSKPEELQLHVGGDETLPAFSDALRGMSPEEEKDIDVSYPEDYGSERLAGKTMQFHVRVKTVRRKELPELNDDFAQDLGDFQNLEELRTAVRNAIFGERQYRLQQEAKNKLVERLIDTHEFPVPEAYVQRQMEAEIERRVQQVAGQGIDPRKLNLDWSKLKENYRERATKDVRGSLLLERVADLENIQTTQEEVDAELVRYARQQREPVAVLRERFKKEGVLDRIAAQIRTEKTLNYLFEHAQRTAPEPAPAETA